MEQWRDADWLDGYRGVLQISNIGRVRRRSYQYEAIGRWGEVHTTTKPDKILATCRTRNGYLEVAVQISGRRQRFLVHRLVARAFVPGYHQDLTVNHINGVKTDNRSENLEWVTLSTNSKKQWDTGLVDLRGDAHPGRKLHSGQVRIIRKLLSMNVSANMLATLCNVSPKVISGIRDGKRWNSVD